MKSASSLRFITLAAVLGAALSTSALAQPGPGAGGMGKMRIDRANTPGWTLMTGQERIANQNRMRETKTYEECLRVQTEHRAAMETRAKEKGLTLRTPRQNACDVAKTRGWVK